MSLLSQEHQEAKRMTQGAWARELTSRLPDYQEVHASVAKENSESKCLGALKLLEHRIRRVEQKSYMLEVKQEQSQAVNIAQKYSTRLPFTKASKTNKRQK